VLTSERNGSTLGLLEGDSVWRRKLLNVVICGGLVRTIYLTKVGASGALTGTVTPPKYISPFGRSYTLRILGNPQAFSDDGNSLTTTIDREVEAGRKISHMLYFGERPDAEIGLPEGAFYSAGEDIPVTISNAHTLTENYGELCSLNLYHAGWVLQGGARESNPADCTNRRRSILTRPPIFHETCC
jgi:hypothetical protein